MRVLEAQHRAGRRADDDYLGASVCAVRDPCADQRTTGLVVGSDAVNKLWLGGGLLSWVLGGGKAEWIEPPAVNSAAACQSKGEGV
jgi:hypothetical protein